MALANWISMYISYYVQLLLFISKTEMHTSFPASFREILHEANYFLLLELTPNRILGWCLLSSRSVTRWQENSRACCVSGLTGAVDLVNKRILPLKSTTLNGWRCLRDGQFAARCRARPLKLTSGKYATILPLELTSLSGRRWSDTPSNWSVRGAVVRHDKGSAAGMMPDEKNSCCSSLSTDGRRAGFDCNCSTIIDAAGLRSDDGILQTIRNK